MTEATEKCLNPKCGGDAEYRGLCVSCYQTARRLVVDGRTSWDALEAEGKCAGRKTRGGITKATSEWLLSAKGDV